MGCHSKCSLIFSESDIVGSIAYLVLDLLAWVVLRADIVLFNLINRGVVSSRSAKSMVDLAIDSAIAPVRPVKGRRLGRRLSQFLIRDHLLSFFGSSLALPCYQTPSAESI